MKLKTCLHSVLWLLSYLTLSDGVISDEEFKKALDSIKTLTNSVTDLKGSLTDLARQTLSQQLFVEERIRSDGNSGLKVIRSSTYGTSSYHQNSHVGGSVTGIHDHSNYGDSLGMGEAIFVLNGVEFRTRHNDYTLRMPSTTSKGYHVVQNLKYPKIPPEVSSKSTLQEQIREMREWFRAFKNQNYTVRDYRQYFKPAFCYLEGAWTLDMNIDEPFLSFRHNLVAGTWVELQQQIRYTSYTGNKDQKENFAYLPTNIVAINETTGKPIYGQWNYRILCYPTEDIPTKYFRLQEDLTYKESSGTTTKKVLESRAARFRLSEFESERFTGYTLLDKIMSKIPGADNIPDSLNEVPMDLVIYDNQYSNFTKLNTGYYHRQFKTGAAGAMGLMHVNRGFSDDMLFFAETTQPLIAPADFKYCYNIRTKNCTVRSARFTYAVPLEVVYMTPLHTWNPYNLIQQKDDDDTRRNGRNGEPSPGKAFNGTHPNSVHYLTPGDFYSSLTLDDADPADTGASTVGVLDREGNVRQVAASGFFTKTYPIADMGTVRLRYPIVPLHVEGSTSWKELSVMKKRMANIAAVTTGTLYFIKMAPAKASGEHYHEFYLTSDEYKNATRGSLVKVTTSLANGHQHELKIWQDPGKSYLEYKTCDGEHRCFDRHPKWMTIMSAPGEIV